MNDKEFYDCIYQLVDTVIEVKKIPFEEIHRREVFQMAEENTENFLVQVNKKIEACKSEKDKNFVKETTLNFLVFALKRIITDYDCPDENIEYMANHLKEQILQLKR